MAMSENEPFVQLELERMIEQHEAGQASPVEIAQKVTEGDASTIAEAGRQLREQHRLWDVAP